MAADGLRAEADARGGSGQLFSRKVADYVASRPDYPAALFDELTCRCPPPAEALDIGAGTGLFTRDLLRRGYRVCAVEPDAAMRAAADAALGAQPGYRSAEGRAEALPVPDASVDLITAAQSFHWFDLEAARAECGRVLRPGGCVALVWNHRADDALNRELSALMQAHGGALAAAMAAEDDLARVPAFFGAKGFQRWQGAHAQRLDADGLAALLFSRSYMPPRDSEAGRAVLADAQALAARHAGADGRFFLRYDCSACIG